MISRAELEALMLRISRLEDEVSYLRGELMPEHWMKDWDVICKDAEQGVVQAFIDGDLEFFKEDLPNKEAVFGSYRDRIGVQYTQLVKRFMSEKVSEISLEEIGILMYYLLGWRPKSWYGILLFFQERGFELKPYGNSIKWSNIIPFE